MRNPPTHLGKDGRSLWRSIATEYAIEDGAGLAILLQAAEALDRLRQAQAAILEKGPMIIDRFGSPKAHPMLPIERDARTAYLAALKALNLDLEPLRDRAGRPGGR